MVPGTFIGPVRLLSAVQQSSITFFGIAEVSMSLFLEYWCWSGSIAQSTWKEEVKWEMKRLNLY